MVLTSAKSPVRIHAIDWLRVLTVLDIFLFHVLHIFDFDPAAAIKNTETSLAASVFIFFSMQWSVQLLFLLAGSSNWFSLRTRPRQAYMRERVWRLLIVPADPPATVETLATKVSDDAPTDNKDLERALHAAIKKVTQSVTDMRFNTSISEMNKFVNEATAATAIPRPWFEAFVKILSPFAPHVCEEIWQRLGHTTTIAYEPWPAYDEAKLARDTLKIGVQVMGKLRSEIEVPADATQETILATAKADQKVQGFIAGKEIKREIYVKGKLVNLVVG